MLGFPLVFKYVSCKTCFLQYKWNYVNSKGICVKKLFISPVLDNNWALNVVVSDRQHSPALEASPPSASAVSGHRQATMANVELIGESISFNQYHRCVRVRVEVMMVPLLSSKTSSATSTRWSMASAPWLVRARPRDRLSVTEGERGFSNKRISIGFSFLGNVKMCLFLFNS